MADVNFKVKNTLVVNTAFSANSTVVNLGNVTITPTNITIGNSSVNVSINSTSVSTNSAITVGVASINTTALVAGANVYLDTSKLNLGNSTVYVIANSSVVSMSNGMFTGTISSAQANVLSQTLADGTTINWDTSVGQIAYVTLGGNRTMAAPSNLKVGTYILHVNQDATGSRTLTWNSVFKWTAGVSPVLSTGANKKDIFTFMSDGTNLYGSYLPDVR